MHKHARAILDSLAVFCPLHGWAAPVYGKPAEGWTGETPYTVVTSGGTAKCSGAHSGVYCGRELVLGTFEAVTECSLDEATPELPTDPHA
jgi:hypothetical protein